MIVVSDRLEEWEINPYEKARLEEGNHRVFSVTKKSFHCPKCHAVIEFYLNSSLDWCTECKEDIPMAGALVTNIGYRISYHFDDITYEVGNA